MESINKTARLSGVLYLLMVPFAIFSMMYAPSVLFISGDIQTTVSNILENKNMLNLSVFSWLICQTIFVYLVLTLYKLLKIINKNHATAMLVLALIPVPIALLNEINYLAILTLLDSNGLMSVLSTEQINMQVIFFKTLHNYGIIISQIFWGLWLLPFGYLVYKSGFIPKILGVLLIVGGLGYLFDVIIYFFFPNMSIAISMLTGISELIFPLWMIIKGINTEKWNSLASKV